MSPSKPLRIEAPISAGELIDKITILEIKTERFGDLAKRQIAAKELALLLKIKDKSGLDTVQIASFADELRMINGALWDIEDAIRECEQRSDFGPRFIELARSVYLTNDRRALAKQRIDATVGSDIVEQKSYWGM